MPFDPTRSMEVLQLLDLTGEPVSLRVELPSATRMRLIAVAVEWRNLNSVFIKVMRKDELLELISKLKKVANCMEMKKGE